MQVKKSKKRVKKRDCKSKKSITSKKKVGGVIYGPKHPYTRPNNPNFRECINNMTSCLAFGKHIN